MDISRRAFVGSLVSVPLGLTLTPLIGHAEHAGGIYTRFPGWPNEPWKALDYLTLHPATYPSHQRMGVVAASCDVAWARQGAIDGELQMYGATALIPEHEMPVCTPERRENLVRSLAECWEQDHSPGWLRVFRYEATGREDEYGEPEIRTWKEWTRVGYVRWMKRSEVT